MSPRGSSRHFGGFVGLVLFVLAFAACSREQLNDMVEKGKKKLDQGVDQVKETVSDGVDQAQKGVQDATGSAQEKLQMAGSITLGADGSFKTSGCYVKFFAPDETRPGILRIQSYRDAANESYPSVYLHAVVEAKKPVDLVGQTIAAQVFAQGKANGPIWSAGSTSPVMIKIVSVSDNQFLAELTGGNLTSNAGQPNVVATGAVEGVWQ